MPVANAEDKRDVISQFIENNMRPKWPDPNGVIKPLPLRTGLGERSDQPECLSHVCCIFLRLIETKQADSLTVYCADVCLSLPREVDLHDWAAFHASFMTSSIALPEKPLA